MRGIFIAQPGKNVADGDLAFRSDKKHLLVNLDSHFGTARVVGTALPADGTEHIETLLTIPHGLDYIPKADVYMFGDGDAFFNFYNGQGKYGRKMLFLVASGGITDVFKATVDATNLYVKHHYTAPGGSGASTAPSNPVNLKYYIYSNYGSDT